MKLFETISVKKELSASIYSLYGLNIYSELPLPVLPVNTKKIDMKVHFDRIIPRFVNTLPNKINREWKLENNNWLLRYFGYKDNVLEFRFGLDGKKIHISQSYLEWRDSIFILSGVVLATSLHLQGKSILHATSLVKNGKSFLLAGFSGAGKSTLAASLVKEGVSFHSDDMAVFTINKDSIIIQAGYPRLKVTPETAKSLGWGDESLIPVMISGPLNNERWIELSTLKNSFYEKSAPLKAIYILSGRDKKIDIPYIYPISKGHGTLSLVRHIYGQPWLVKPGKRLMDICSQIIRNIPVYKVVFPDDLSKLRQAACMFIDSI